jgi:hypothetical protein
VADAPDPWDLLAELKITNRPMSQKTSDVLHHPESLIRNFGIDPENLAGAESLTGVENFFQASPIASSTSEYMDAIGIHESESGYYYDPQNEAYEHEQFDPEVHRYTGAPSPITYVPTSTTNPQRPRTVAAGYQYFKAEKSGVLTVVFRDGTFWNYYGVPNLVWNNFKTSRSKGRYIVVHLEKYEYGPADVSSFNSNYRETLYRLARSSQVAREGYTGKQKKGSKRGTGHRPYTTYGSTTGGVKGPRGGDSLGGGTGRKRNKPKP